MESKKPVAGGSSCSPLQGEMRLGNSLQNLKRLESASRTVLKHSNDILRQIKDTFKEGTWLDASDARHWTKHCSQFNSDIHEMLNCSESLRQCLHLLRRKEVNAQSLEWENENLFSALHEEKQNVTELQTRLTDLEKNARAMKEQLHFAEKSRQLLEKSREDLKQELKFKEEDFHRLLVQVRSLNEQLIYSEHERESLVDELKIAREQHEKVVRTYSFQINHLETHLVDNVDTFQTQRNVSEMFQQMEDLQDSVKKLEFEKSLLTTENSVLRAKVLHFNTTTAPPPLPPAPPVTTVVNEISPNSPPPTVSTMERGTQTVEIISQLPPAAPMQKDYQQMMLQQQQLQNLSKMKINISEYQLRFEGLAKELEVLRKDHNQMKSSNQRQADTTKRLEMKVQEKEKMIQQIQNEKHEMCEKLNKAEMILKQQMTRLTENRNKEETNRLQLQNYIDFLRSSYSTIFKDTDWCSQLV